MIVTSLCQSCLKLEWQRAHGHQWSWSGQLLNLSSCRIDHRLSTSHQPQVCSHLPRRKTPHRNSAQVEFLCRLRSEDRVSWLKLWNVNVDRYQSVEQQLVQVNWLLFKTLLANPALVVSRPTLINTKRAVLLCCLLLSNFANYKRYKFTKERKAKEFWSVDAQKARG